MFSKLSGRTAQGWYDAMQTLMKELCCTTSHPTTRRDDFILVEVAVDGSDSEVEALPPPPPPPKRRRDRGEWAGYNPDDDDYDMKAATQPPSAETEDVEDRTSVGQILHLAGRVSAGGDAHVVHHYAHIIQEMESGLSDASRVLLHQHTRRRRSSQDSFKEKLSVGTASTGLSEGLSEDATWCTLESSLEIEDDDDWLLVAVQA